MTTIKTLGDLRRLTEDLPDETLISTLVFDDPVFSRATASAQICRPTAHPSSYVLLTLKPAPLLDAGEFVEEGSDFDLGGEAG